MLTNSTYRMNLSGAVPRIPLPTFSSTHPREFLCLDPSNDSPAPTNIRRDPNVIAKSGGKSLSEVLMVLLPRSDRNSRLLLDPQNDLCSGNVGHRRSVHQLSLSFFGIRRDSNETSLRTGYHYHSAPFLCGSGDENDPWQLR